jgi:hypothetical protein
MNITSNEPNPKKKNQLNLNGKELKKLVNKWEESKTLTEKEFFEKLDELV